MARIILITAAQTDWDVQGRLAGDTELPLSEAGHREAVDLAKAVAEFGPSMIRSGTDQPARQTASLMAHDLKLRTRALDGLREMHLGLWQGLMHDDLKERFGKVYRQWRSEPLSIEPPEGETIARTGERLVTAIKKLMKRRQDELPAVVLGRYAYSVLRCRLKEGGFEHFWEFVDDARKPVVCEWNELG